jgi:hypothetical protein
MQHFRLIDSLNPAAMLAALDTHEDRFGDITVRQAARGTPHVDTESIYLRMPPILDVCAFFESLLAVDYPAMQEPVFAKGLDDLAGLVAGKIARAMIVRLKPRGLIAPHVDEGGYSEATDRYHWCIRTNPQSFCRIGTEMAHMQPGEVWFFDKHATHACCNLGETPRVHLIMDCWKQPS